MLGMFARTGSEWVEVMTRIIYGESENTPKLLFHTSPGSSAGPKMLESFVRNEKND